MRLIFLTIFIGDKISTWLPLGVLPFVFAAFLQISNFSLSAISQPNRFAMPCTPIFLFDI